MVHKINIRTIIFEEQITLINVFLIFCNSSFNSRFLIVKISTMLLVFVQFSSIFEWTNMEESWTKTRSIEEILTTKECVLNGELQNARKILISVRYFSNTI